MHEVLGLIPSLEEEEGGKKAVKIPFSHLSR
jgi:hypothetical protein